MREILEMMSAILGGGLEYAILFAGCFLLIFILCLLHYQEETDSEKRKDTLVQWIVLDALFAVGIFLALLMP